MVDRTYSSKAAASAFGESMIRIGTPVISAQLDVPLGRAERAMYALVQAVIGELARTYVYIPASFDNRNQEIFEKYHQPSRGAAACSYARIRQLAAEYAVSSRWIYNIVKQGPYLGLDAQRTASEVTSTRSATTADSPGAERG